MDLKTIINEEINRYFNVEMVNEKKNQMMIKKKEFVMVP